VQTLLPFEQLAAYFYIEKLSRSPARFDVNQLMYWQKMAVQQLDDTHLWRWLGDKVVSQVPESMQPLFAATIRANIEFPQDASLWAKIFFHDHVPIESDEMQIIREAGEQFFVEAEQAVDKYGINLKPILDDMKQSLGVSGKKLFMPLRVALTGKTHGPELAQIAELLGQEKMKLRFGSAFKLASGRSE
jgi:glutamyl-tRNA synthetase